jgi:hypothetical protein
MSFTQQKKMNFIHCDGCEKRCELGAVKIIAMMGYYYPKIGGECIYQYIDKNNQVRLAAQDELKSATAAIEKAREIAKLCDKYKAR